MTKTFYVVLSRDGIEGCFPERADAEAYLAELRGIGVAGLRIEVREIAEQPR